MEGTTMLPEDRSHHACLLDEFENDARRLFADHGDPEAVVLFLDLQDRYAATLARGVTERAYLRRLRAEARRKQQHPLLLVVVGRDEAVRLLTPVIPDPANLLGSPHPADHFRVAVLSRGYTTLGVLSAGQSKPPCTVIAWAEDGQMHGQVFRRTLPAGDAAGDEAHDSPSAPDFSTPA
jgi:hypothetical protein